jgi:transcriptional regulator GlxA family with amidase domain
VRIGILLSGGFSFLKLAALVDLIEEVNQAKALFTSRGYSVELLSQQGSAVQSGHNLKVSTDKLEPAKASGFRRIFRLDGDALFSFVEGDFVSRLVQCENGKGSGSVILREHPKQVTSLDAVNAVVNLIREDCEQGEAQRLITLVEQKFSMHPLLRSDTSSREARMRASARWLVENLSKKITVADAAEQVSMSERSYLRNFRQVIGIAPSDFLINARLDRVCELLEQCDYPADKLARICGFRDGSHLARTLKARRFTTVSDYRRAQVSRAPPSARD